MLHDVLEDTATTEDDLRAAGCPEPVIAAVRALTKNSGEPLEDSIARAASNPIARAVKRADIADNSDPDRLALLDTATAQRLATSTPTASGSSTPTPATREHRWALTGRAAPTTRPKPPKNHPLPTAVPHQTGQAPKAYPPAPTAATAQPPLTRPAPRRRQESRASQRFPGLPLKKRSGNEDSVDAEGTPESPMATETDESSAESDGTPANDTTPALTREDDPSHHGPGLSSAESGDHNPTSEQDQAPEGQASHPTTGWRPRQKHRRHRQMASTNPEPPIRPEYSPAVNSVGSDKSEDLRTIDGEPEGTSAMKPVEEQPQAAINL